MKNNTLNINDKLLNKIYAYYQTIWREKWKENIENNWLLNFEHTDEDELNREKVNMLYLLTKFMYFGNNEIRELLHSLYRDLFTYPIISQIRKSNSDTLDESFIKAEFLNELLATKFLGVGNPSESGVHMLYYFRQECQLSKKYFINASEIFKTSEVIEKLSDGSEKKYLKSEINYTNIKRYIFIDDFCGSGSQATIYLKNIVESMKFENKDLEINYLMLFGTDEGINNIKSLRIFNKVEAVFSLDSTFKTFSDQSRYYTTVPDVIIEKAFSKATATKYGLRLLSGAPLGFNDCQLLLSMFHNTPDNSLPIFWSEKNDWKPIFKRYNKLY